MVLARGAENVNYEPSAATQSESNSNQVVDSCKGRSITYVQSLKWLCLTVDSFPFLPSVMFTVCRSLHFVAIIAKKVFLN